MINHVYWASMWPIENVRMLQTRFKTWYNSYDNCSDLYLISKANLVTLLSEMPGRRNLCDRTTADAIVTMLETDIHESYSDESELDEEIMLDMLQALVGLCILCQGKVEEKIRFICSLFDLNETEELSEDQVTAIIMTACRSLFRLGGIILMPSNDQVQILVDQLFISAHANNVSIEMFQKWVLETSEIRNVFSITESIGAFRDLLRSLDFVCDIVQEKREHIDNKNPAIISNSFVEYVNENTVYLVCTSTTAGLVTAQLYVGSAVTDLSTHNLSGYVNNSFNCPCLFNASSNCVANDKVRLQFSRLKSGEEYMIVIGKVRHRFMAGVPLDIVVDLNQQMNQIRSDVMLISIGSQRSRYTGIHQVIDIPQQEIQCVPFGEGNMLFLVNFTTSAVNERSAMFQRALNREVSFEKLCVLFVGDSCTPLLGRDAPLKVKQMNEEILNCLHVWQVQVREAGLNPQVVALIGTNGCSFNEIVHNDGLTIQQFVDYELKPGSLSLKNSFQLKEAIPRYPFNYFSLNKMLGDSPNILLGPVVGAISNYSSVRVMVEFDKGLLVQIELFEATLGRLVDSTIVYCKSMVPVTVCLTGLVKQSSYIVKVNNTYEATFHNCAKELLVCNSPTSSDHDICVWSNLCDGPPILHLGSILPTVDLEIALREISSVITNVTLAKKYMGNFLRLQLMDPLLFRVLRSSANTASRLLPSDLKIPSLLLPVVKEYLAVFESDDNSMEKSRIFKFTDISDRKVYDRLDSLKSCKEPVVFIFEQSRVLDETCESVQFLRAVFALSDFQLCVVYPAVSSKVAWNGYIADTATGRKFEEVCIPATGAKFESMFTEDNFPELASKSLDFGRFTRTTVSQYDRGIGYVALCVPELRPRIQIMSSLELTDISYSFCLPNVELLKNVSILAVSLQNRRDAIRECQNELQHTIKSLENIHWVQTRRLNE